MTQGSRGFLNLRLTKSKKVSGKYVHLRLWSPSPTLVLEYITKIEEMLNVPNLASFAQFEKRLREKLVAVKSDPNLLSALDQLELIRPGS